MAQLSTALTPKGACQHLSSPGRNGTAPGAPQPPHALPSTCLPRAPRAPSSEPGAVAAASHGTWTGAAGLLCCRQLSQGREKGPTCPGGCQADGFGGQSFPVLVASGKGWPNSDPGAQKVILNTQFCRPGILTLAVTLSSEPFTHRNTGWPDGHSPAQGGILLNVFQRLQRGPLRDEPASAERRGNLGVKTAL